MDPERHTSEFVIPSPHFDLVAGPDETFWVVNPGKRRIESYSRPGELQSMWGQAGAALADFFGCCNPAHLALLPDGRFVTSEKGIPRIKIYSEAGEFAARGGRAQRAGCQRLGVGRCARRSGGAGLRCGRRTGRCRARVGYAASVRARVLSPGCGGQSRHEIVTALRMSIVAPGWPVVRAPLVLGGIAAAAGVLVSRGQVRSCPQDASGVSRPARELAHCDLPRAVGVRSSPGTAGDTLMTDQQPLIGVVF